MTQAVLPLLPHLLGLVLLLLQSAASHRKEQMEREANEDNELARKHWREVWSLALKRLQLVFTTFEGTVPLDSYIEELLETVSFAVPLLSVQNTQHPAGWCCDAAACNNTSTFLL